jgi:hypothetical protein
MKAYFQALDIDSEIQHAHGDGHQKSKQGGMG